MHELQSLLLQKLPRLGELTFWCMIEKSIFMPNPDVPAHKDPFRVVLWEAKWDMFLVADRYWKIEEIPRRKIKAIIWHDISHSDILEALGEDYWLCIWGTADDCWKVIYMLTKRDKNDIFHKYWHGDDDTGRYILLPRDLSDLSLPEYEETRKQLIQLLTK